MSFNCQRCKSSLYPGSQFCHNCGLQFTGPVPTVDDGQQDSTVPSPSMPPAQPAASMRQTPTPASAVMQGLASATKASSPDWVAIVIATLLEVMGASINFARDELTFMGGSMLLIATLLGFYLLASRNKVNRIVGIVTTILMLVWIACIMFPGPNRVSGTYQSQLGIASVVLDPDGTFSYQPVGGQAVSGTYEIDDNTMRLDLTSGQLAQKGMANTPIGELLSTAYTAQLSDDRNSFMLAGTEFVKTQSHN